MCRELLNQSWKVQLVRDDDQVHVKIGLTLGSVTFCRHGIQSKKRNCTHRITEYATIVLLISSNQTDQNTKQHLHIPVEY
jgi:hypothetical protein